MAYCRGGKKKVGQPSKYGADSCGCTPQQVSATGSIHVKIEVTGDNFRRQLHTNIRVRNVLYGWLQYVQNPRK